MISVLLVEDNKLALEYLETIIDWERHGFTVVGAALNGKEGLREYFALKPQVVITDIAMPAVSGIELAARIREAGGDARILFLTSYQLFSYAKSALDLGVSEYILKHELCDKTLIQRLERIKAEIEVSVVMARVRFENEIVESMFGETESQLQNGDALCTFLAFRRNSPLDILGRGEQVSTSIDAKRVKKLCYSSASHVMGVVQAEGDMFLLFASPGAVSANDLAYGLKDALETNLGGSFTVLIIGDGVKIMDCRRQYLALRDMFCYRFFTKRSVVLNSVFYDGDVGPCDVRLDEGLLTQAVGDHDIDLVLKLVDSAFCSVIEFRDYGGLLDLSRRLMSVLQRHEGVEDTAFGERFMPYAAGDEQRWYTAKGAAEFFRDKFIELVGILRNGKSDRYSPHVRTAVRYLTAEFKNVDLSVESIAQRIGMNADWLGAIFKRDTGYSAREYLNTLRINKSKELIDNGFKVSEVHKEVGYLTYQYFGKVFRKKTGSTPTEYRRSKNGQTIV